MGTKREKGLEERVPRLVGRIICIVALYGVAIVIEYNQGLRIMEDLIKINIGYNVKVGEVGLSYEDQLDDIKKRLYELEFPHSSHIFFSYTVYCVRYSIHIEILRLWKKFGS